ncbi:MAG: hypothetical protein QOJ13_269 [Gaiellales bacterium]|jgi:hypothetical protein|nr:hypothetical protein [Gaiellales bacterium]
MRGDARSQRVAIVPDNVVNGPPGGVDHLAALEEAGWGVIALCPPGLVPEAREMWLDAIVEQVITFLDDDYEVALAAGDDPETEQFIRALAATGRTVQLQLALQ